MKVLLINTSESTGGAAIAAGRLMKSLNETGVDARMLVLHKTSGSDRVVSVGKPWQKKGTFLWERLVIWTNNLFSRKNLFTVSIADSGFDVTRLPEFQEADLIHLHWINQGLLSLRGIRQILRSGKPVVWTMHDMWECTGICHHAHTCEFFKSECRNCRFLRFPGPHDLANRVFRKKQELFRDSRFNIVAVSNWLAAQVRQSTLLKEMPLSVIPNTLSLAEFTPADKAQCRDELSLPGKKTIVFGAARIDDPIKGFNLLLQSLRFLITTGKFAPEELHLILFGTIKHPETILPQIPVSYTDFGRVTNVSLLSKIYSASDLAVSASYYETFGQTLIEAQACGCIPVSFGNSGQADLIRHKETGYLADYLSVESLAEGIRWAINKGPSEVSRENLRGNVLKNYSGDIVAGQYIRLYRQLIKKVRS